MKAPLLNLNASTNDKIKDTFIIKSVFQGENDGYYVFRDDLDETYQFQTCIEKVLMKYDLNGTKEVGREFKVTYIVISNDEYEDIELEIINMEEA